MTAERKQSKILSTQSPKEDESIPSIDQQNWRGIGISLLVILAISSLIALAILLLSPRGYGEEAKREKFYLSDVVTGEFHPRKFNGTWLTDTELLFQNSHGHVVIYSILTKKEKIVLRNSTLEEHSVRRYYLSPDREYVLFAQDLFKVFRYTFHAKYKIFHIETKLVFPLSPSVKPDAHLEYAGWGPSGNQLAYVYRNDVYYVNHVNGSHHALSTTGIAGVVFNGVPDWVYEEEILSSNRAIWWSENGSYLCYASFNDTKVDAFHYTWYGDYGDPNNLYPQLLNLRYPKAGRHNPSISLWVADLRNLSKITVRDVKPPREVRDQLVHVWDHYFTAVKWVDDARLSVIWMRRVQNYSALTVCDGELWFCHVVYEVYVLNKKGWVDLYQPPEFATNRDIWFMKMPLTEGLHGSYRHVGMLDTTLRRIDYLTQGKYDIVLVHGYSEATNSVFYESTLEGRAGERHLYSVTATRALAGRKIRCHTCDIGVHCLYNSVIPSPSKLHYILDCMGPGVPRIELRSAINDTVVSVLDANEDLEEKLEHRAMPQIRTFQVPISGGYKAQVRMFLPTGLADDEAILYPMVVNTYGAPGSQLVNERFDIHWGIYLASRRNYIYAWIDGRGSGFQGDRMQYELYYKVGTVEVQDQIGIARYLRDNLPFIDPSHIAIWGWSYGGYVATSAIAEEETVFKCGIAVAPVINWLYYDSTYTERYMGTPKPTDNYLGYEKANLLKRAGDLKGTRFLLIHGTADDNVHFQHTMMFIKALKDAAVLFQLQVYPDEDHTLSNVKLHLYTTMEDFLKDCFYVEPKDELEATRVKKDVKGR